MLMVLWVFSSDILSTFAADRTPLESFFYVQGFNSSAAASTAELDSSRAFGDYQYYMSFGGDQYFNLPAAIDNIFGTSGIYPQLGHVLAQPNFEAAGYTAIGESAWSSYTSGPKPI